MHQIFPLIPIITNITLYSVFVAPLLDKAFNITDRAFDFHLSTNFEGLS
jgi:hypothetical protein